MARIRRVFDLDAEVGAIAARLSRDVTLAPLVAARPGLRVPGGWDGFELAIRAVLGQQISMAAARGLAARLVVARSEPLRPAAPRLPWSPGLTAVFPRPERLVGFDFGILGMPRTRAATLAALTARAVADPGLLAPSPESDLESALARLRALPGIGEWTAQYIAMRALRHPDAFPASDLGLLRAAAVDGVRPRPRELLARAEAWRPWRAYAASYLWTCVDPGATTPSNSRSATR